MTEYSGPNTLTGYSLIVKEALRTKQDALTGQPGQVVGFDASGTAGAVRGWSNPNLLYNWYFLDPINQRGQTEYTVYGYTIDGWCISGAIDKFVITADGITGYNKAPNRLYLAEYIEGLDVASVYTFSVLSDGELYSITGVPGKVSNKATPFGDIRLQLKYEDPTIVQPVVAFLTSATLQAAKLELGPVQTLAHKESDTWVLNDPPPNKALELAKCQRHQFNLGGVYTAFGDNGNSQLRLSIPSKNLRATPVISGVNVAWCRTNGNLIMVDSEVSVVAAVLGKDTLYLILDIPGRQFSVGQAVQISIASGFVDANL